ncbi:MAG: cysteine peptidase family C39 domain-containing protein [Planctomycetota bacterium]
MQTEWMVPIALTSGLILSAFKLGTRFLLRRPQWDSPIMLGAVSIAFVITSGWFGHLAWAGRMPFSAEILNGNVASVLLGFASGLAGHVVGLRQRTRPLISAALMCLAIGFVITPVARTLFFPLNLSASSNWNGEVCLQSHPASCAPAAAVTLLAQHGVEASEQELAVDCWTSAMGTEPLGLYRGLASMARRNGLRARVASSDPQDWIRKGQIPNASLVRFKPLRHEHRRVFFGSAREGHVVTILGRTDGGRWIVGDPAIGRITWSDEELRSCFTGDAIYLSDHPLSKSEPASVR